MNNVNKDNSEELEQETLKSLSANSLQEVDTDSDVLAAGNHFVKERARRLKTFREQKLGMSQQDFSTLLGINQRTFERWDVGRSKMPKHVELWMKLIAEKPSIKKWLQGHQ